MVLGLYWEKLWPVWAFRRIKIFFREFSILGVGATGGRGDLPNARDT
jgi:hypothetical protein